MHFRLPLQVRILVHLVGPDGRVEFEAAGDGDDFLAVGHAARADDARDGDAFGAAEVGVGEFGAATGTRLRSASLQGGFLLCIVRAGRVILTGCRAKARRYDFFTAVGADVDVFAERNFDGFEKRFVVEAEALAVGNVTDVRAELAVGPKKVADYREKIFDFVVALDKFRNVAGGARGGDVFE